MISSLSKSSVPVNVQNSTINTNPQSVNFRSAGALERVPETDRYEKKEQNSLRNVVLGTAVVIGLAATIDACFFKSKGRKKVVEFAKETWEKMFSKSKEKPSTPETQVKPPVTDLSSKSQKQNGVKISEKPVAKRQKWSRKITPDRESQVVSNIYISYVDGNTRKLVEKSKSGTVSKKQQARYDRGIKYKPMSSQQENIMAKKALENSAQRAELNSIGSLAEVSDKLKTIATESIPEMKIINNVCTNSNGNVYHFDDAGNVVKVELFQRLKDGTLKANGELTDTLKIQKHLTKQNVKLSDMKEFTMAQSA